MQYIIGIGTILLGVMGLIIATFLYERDKDNLYGRVALYVLEITQIILGILILSNVPILLIYTNI